MKPDTPPGAPADRNPRSRYPLEDAEELLGAAPSPRVRRAVLAAAVHAVAPAGVAPRNDASHLPASPWRRLRARVSARPALPVAMAMATGIFAVALSVQIAPEHPVEAGARVAAASVERTETVANAPIPDAGKPAPPAADVSPQLVVPAPRADDARQEMPGTASAKAQGLSASAPPSAPRVMMKAPAVVDAPTALAMTPEPPVAARADAAPLAPRPVPAVQNRLLPLPQAAGAAPAPQTALANAESRAPAAPASATARAGADAQPGPGEQLRHIIRLRAQHQDADADRELAEFVRRYPDIAVPPAARRQ